VTYAGRPLAGAEVEFTPVGPGTSSVGFTNPQGAYELQYTLQKKGALIGEHKVQIRLLSEDENAQKGIRNASRVANLQYEVSSGANEINVDLPAVKGRPEPQERRR
jgi:hypothetical protein